MTRKQTLSPSAIDLLSAGALKYPFTPGLLVHALPSGKKVWKYMRRVASNGILAASSCSFRLKILKNTSTSRLKQQASSCSVFRP